MSVPICVCTAATARPRHRVVPWVRLAMLAFAVVLLAAACNSSDTEERSVDDAVSESDQDEGSAGQAANEDVDTDADTDVDTDTDIEEAGGPTIDGFYLPSQVPEGFELEALTFLRQSDAFQMPPPAQSASITIGDSDWSSDTSLHLSAYRFDSPADLDAARLIEDGSVVLNGGPDFALAIGESTVIYDSLGGPDEVNGGYFHTVVDGALITGVILGDAADTSQLAQTLATIDVTLTDDGLQIDVDGSALGLTTEIYRGAVTPGFFNGYDLTYSDGVNRFIVSVNPASPEAMLASAQVFVEGERFVGERGSGYIVSQPEVGAALGSRRLLWWVPTARLDVAYGPILDDATAQMVAESFQEVDAVEWEAATADIAVSTDVLGPESLPEDPQAKLDELLAERDRPAAQREIHDLDVADMTAFIGDLRGVDFPVDPTIDWIGPVELDQQVAGMSGIPSNVEDVMLAMRLIRFGDSSYNYGDLGRPVSGLCCGEDSVTLAEGMDYDKAAVVAAHELTHLFDTLVVQPGFTSSGELLNPSIAVLEGNATRVMLLYRDARGLRYDPDPRRNNAGWKPAPIFRMQEWVYEEGERFVAALAEVGGEDAVNRALTTDPPVTTEHILHLDSYLNGDLPIEVPLPEAPDGIEVTQQGTMGAYVIALSTLRGLGWEDARALAGSWAGDSFVQWADDRLQCITATIEFDDASAAALYAANTTAETATATGATVTITKSCTIE